MSGKRKYGAMSTTQLLKKARKYNKQRASAQPSLQRAVAAAVRKTVEKKGVDFPLTEPTILATTNTNASSFCINLVQAGAGSWNRVGRKIQLQSVRLRGTIRWLSKFAATTSNFIPNTVRMVVVWDKQPSDSTIASFDQVFGVTGQDGSETCTFLNPVRYDNMDRFSVVRDCVIDFNPDIANSVSGTLTQSFKSIAFDEYITLKGKETVFSANTSPMTTAGLSTGALLVYFRAAENTAGTNTCEVTSNSFARLRYIDP